MQTTECCALSFSFPLFHHWQLALLFHRFHLLLKRLCHHHHHHLWHRLSSSSTVDAAAVIDVFFLPMSKTSTVCPLSLLMIFCFFTCIFCVQTCPICVLDFGVFLSDYLSSVCCCSFVMRQLEVLPLLLLLRMIIMLR